MQALDVHHACASDGSPLLCRYVETFDQQTMLEMTQVVSAEGAALVEAQTSALFGDLKQLQRQMQAGFPSPLLPPSRIPSPTVASPNGDMLAAGRHTSCSHISRF